MATKKVSHAALKWSLIAERVPARQKDAFSAFKLKTVGLGNKVNLKADSLPKIDFDYYKKAIADKAMVDKFAKMYAALSVPYPKDTAGLLSTVEKEEQDALKKREVYIASRHQAAKGSKEMLAKLDILPPFDEMTQQMFNYYFPQTCIDPRKEEQLRIVPHDDLDAQPGMGSVMYYNKKRGGDFAGYTSVQAYEYHWQKIYDAQEKEKAAKKAADALNAAEEPKAVAAAKN